MNELSNSKEKETKYWEFGVVLLIMSCMLRARRYECKLCKQRQKKKPKREKVTAFLLLVLF